MNLQVSHKNKSIQNNNSAKSTIGTTSQYEPVDLHKLNTLSQSDLNFDTDSNVNIWKSKVESFLSTLYNKSNFPRNNVIEIQNTVTDLISNTVKIVQGIVSPKLSNEENLRLDEIINFCKILLRTLKLNINL